jgi:hypothetical protein
MLMQPMLPFVHKDDGPNNELTKHGETGRAFARSGDATLGKLCCWDFCVTESKMRRRQQKTDNWRKKDEQNTQSEDIITRKLVERRNMRRIGSMQFGACNVTMSS